MVELSTVTKSKEGIGCRFSGHERSMLPGLLFALLTAVSAELVLSSFFKKPELLLLLARGSVIFLTIYAIHRFLVTAIRSYRPSLKDLGTTTLVIVGSLVVVWIGHALGASIAESLAKNLDLPGVSAGTVAFAIPYAAGALLLQSVLGLHFGLLYSLVFTLLMVVYGPREPLLGPFVLVTSLVGCLSLTSIRSRSAYLRAGINIFLVGLPCALGSAFLQPEVAGAEIVLRLGGVAVGGLLCYLLAIGFTPLIEHVGDYVTDIRLLEMATLDHPLLKDLSVQAPGTWNHSMVMGMMVEAAAQTVGANPVLCRVAAYFHDIGKLKKPLYFVENQAGGENRHDKLSSSMSALIIKSHVKDGLELARKYKLPKPIQDMIPQHHGTALIEYFYNKAVQEATEAAGEPAEVDPLHYSYPGPKPQTKEAGILMLADGIEAAARTISEPSIDRVQGLVQKMINKTFRSGELNECDLTLQDLHQIAACFTRILSAIYHQRVAYAEPAEKVAEKGSKAAATPTAATAETSPAEDGATPAPLGGADSEKKGAQSASKKSGDKEDRQDDLKRLGM